MTQQMFIRLIDEKAKLPTKGSTDSAGYDLYSIESYTLKPGERKMFKTGIQLAIPQGLYARIAPRSGLAVKKGIDVMAGVMDSDYRGEYLVTLINLGQEDVAIEVGDRIAQFILEVCVTLPILVTDSLEGTNRGENGIGSTGTK